MHNPPGAKDSGVIGDFARAQKDIRPISHVYIISLNLNLIFIFQNLYKYICVPYNSIYLFV